MKIVIAIDWLDKYAGSERVITSMSKVFRFSEVYSLISLMSAKDMLKTFNGNIPVLITSHISYSGKFFRALFPLFSFFMRRLKVSSDIDIIISSSHAVAKAIPTPRKVFHVSYFQARNMKYIWDEQELYLTGLKNIYRPLIPSLKNQDFIDAQNPDLIIVNSKFVQNWVKATYMRDSILIYPPVNVSSFDLGRHDSSFFVTVGRLEPYKRFDLLVDAFNLNGLKLVVIGDGSQRKMLESTASSNVEFVGYLDSNEINQYLGRARGFVYAGVEDFGIAPVEAQATGCPVICLDMAGTAETIKHGKTGSLFKDQSVESINLGIDYFIANESLFDYAQIRENALNFSEEKFLIEIEKYIFTEYEIFKARNND